VTTFIISGPLQGVYRAVPPAQAYVPGPYQPPTYWAPPTQPAYPAATQQAYPNTLQQAYLAATQLQNPYALPMQQVPANPTNIKIEALTAMVNKFSKMLKTAIETQQDGTAPHRCDQVALQLLQRHWPLYQRLQSCNRVLPCR
jgi:hypothetical protein